MYCWQRLLVLRLLNVCVRYYDDCAAYIYIHLLRLLSYSTSETQRSSTSPLLAGYAEGGGGPNVGAPRLAGWCEKCIFAGRSVADRARAQRWRRPGKVAPRQAAWPDIEGELARLDRSRRSPTDLTTPAGPSSGTHHYLDRAAGCRSGTTLRAGAYSKHDARS